MTGIQSQPAADHAAGRRARSVLVVDDQEAVLVLLATLLAQWGYDVLSARSAAEALQLLQTVDSIDLLIADIVLPRIDGFDLVARARVLRPALKVLYISAYPGRHADKAARAFHAECLRKPFWERELLGAVERALGAA